MPECPTCGKALNTRQGVRQHHTKVHGEPLPNRTCTGCGVDFYDEKARLEFCKDCNPNAGEHNGNWKDAQETAECKLCDGEFKYFPSDKDGVYCPECVENSTSFLGKHYYEVVDVERIERECDYCEKEMEVLASERKYGEGRFCCKECLWEWMSQNRRGKNHHQWLTGDDKYAGHWWRARENALERDDYQCRNCGITTEGIGRNPDVHHLVPLREFEEPQQAHTLDNLVSLCPDCHRKAEAGKITVPNPPFEENQE